MRNFMTHVAGISFGLIGSYLAIHQISAWAWFFVVAVIIELAAVLMDFACFNPQFRNDDD